MNERMNKIINENSALIYSIAKRYAQYNNIEDLYQAGCIGIIKAFNNYKKESNVKFSTYAYKYIMGEMIDFIRKDKSIIMSDEVYDVYRKYVKVKELLFNKKEREATFSEICSFMEISEKQMLNIIESVSFSKNIDNELVYGEVYQDNRDEIDNEILISNELDYLNEFDYNLINYRYFQGYSQDETARLMGISQSKASRCEKIILKRIKENLAN